MIIWHLYDSRWEYMELNRFFFSPFEFTVYGLNFTIITVSDGRLSFRIRSFIINFEIYHKFIINLS
jgi:hypothetical protein